MYTQGTSFRITENTFHADNICGQSVICRQVPIRACFWEPSEAFQENLLLRLAPRFLKPDPPRRQEDGQHAHAADAEGTLQRAHVVLAVDGHAHDLKTSESDAEQPQPKPPNPPLRPGPCWAECLSARLGPKRPPSARRLRVTAAVPFSPKDFSNWRISHCRASSNVAA